MYSLEDAEAYVTKRIDHYKCIRSTDLGVPYFPEELAELTKVESYVNYNQDFFWVLDERQTLHSYLDIPSSINVEAGVIGWHKNGIPHRENNLPSRIDTEVHKATWQIKGALHRTDGPAMVTPKISYFGLFGALMEEEQFDSIIQRTQATHVPLYMSFLIDYDIIEERDVQVFLDDQGLWGMNLPVQWMLQALGVTEEALQVVHWPPLLNPQTPLQVFTSVASHIDTTLGT